jgi:predicted nucleic acid-binding protein
LGTKASRDSSKRYFGGGLPTPPRREALLIRLFLDINVVLDVLANRETWVEHSAAVLSLLDDAEVEGLIAAHSVTTLYYLTSRHLGHKRTVAALIGLLEHLSVAPLDEDILLRALSLGWADVEDAVQGISAQRANADYIVTRNPGDFEADSVPVVTPKQLLATLASSAD